MTSITYVRKYYPDAACKVLFKEYYIWATTCRWMTIIGEGETKLKAWYDAKNRIEKQIK